MFGAIPAGVIMDLAYASGYREQLRFDQDFPPCIYISRDKLTSVPMGYNWDGFGSISTKDHPAFTELRDRLEQEGFIKTERWSNGDRVLKPFYLNNMFFDVGEQFSCAPALGGTYNARMKKDEYPGVSDKPMRYEEQEEVSFERCPFTYEMEF